MNQPTELRKTRCDAKLLHLPEEQRERIIEWSRQQNAKDCLQRIATELNIQVSLRTLYDTLTRWKAKALYASLRRVAEAQADAEATAKGGMTAAEIEEAVDRKFLAAAVKEEDVKLYQQLRYLRITDQKAKRLNRVAEASIQRGEQALQQREWALKLAERKVVVLEERFRMAAHPEETKTLSAEERARRVREILRA